MFSMELREQHISMLPARDDSCKSATASAQPENALDMLSALCEILEYSGRCRFVVSGFGDDLWPVDIETDLLTILEQLPDAIAGAHGHRDFELYFYEQGIERKVIFGIERDTYNVQCISLSDWQPAMAHYVAAPGEIYNMLCEFVSQFDRVARTICPDAIKNKYYESWISKCVC